MHSLISGMISALPARLPRPASARFLKLVTATSKVRTCSALIRARSATRSRRLTFLPASPFPPQLFACEDLHRLPRQVHPCKPTTMLARLAVKYGAEILLDDLLVRLSSDRPWRDDLRGTCGARFTDMPPRRPPGLPAALMRFRVVKDGKS
jgi:hypothetical protein